MVNVNAALLRKRRRNVQSDSSRAEFLKNPKLRLVEIADHAAEITGPIDADELNAQIDKGLKAYRDKRREAKRGPRHS